MKDIHIKISREFAKKKSLKVDDVYQNQSNSELIDKFIKFYNKLKIKNNKKEVIKLTNENNLSDFLLDSDNEIGKTYIVIYKQFIKKQNKELEQLLDAKIISEVFNSNCTNKINIQEIQEDEIFTFKMPKKFAFIDLVFNSSYRKIIDNKNKDYTIYKDYIIDLDSIENNITDLLVKNKKLLSDNIIEFKYNNNIFNNEVSDLITLFKKNYEIIDISIDDKLVLYNLLKIMKEIIPHREI